MLNRMIKFSVVKTQFSTTSTMITRKRLNPGVHRVLNEINDIEEKIAEDPESFGDLESDFMAVHKTHKQYTNEMEAYKDFIRLKIVKRKYFKEKYPNFLTFAEKEQIRLLNKRDPEEWNIEKLCESFPASDETISKILKADWYPRTEQRLKKHDEKVLENWERFRKGEFSDLPPDLTAHLKKFCERKLDDIKNIETKWLPKRPVVPKPKTNEFLRIITSCKGYQKHNLIEGPNNHGEIKTYEVNHLPSNEFRTLENPGDDETFVIGNINDKMPITLSVLKEKAGLTTKEKSLPAEISAENTENVDILNDSMQTNPFSTFVNKFNEITISSSNIQKYNVDPIKERIHIPNKLWKKGATYKVKDCYYDYDGTFLYRVPGMTGHIKKEDS